VRYLLEGLGVFGLLLGIFWGVVALRQDILVEPYLSFDPKEAFQQQFTITNNGPFDVYDIHYTCAVTSIRLNDGTSGGFPDWIRDIRVVYVMFPVTKPPIKTFHWKQKTNTECDFIGRFGTQLKSANIEIDVAYKRWLRNSEIETIGGKFSGKRDTAGNFQWVYGSDSPSPLEPPTTKKATVVIIPF
jgi:hypothetical protein